MQVEFCPKMEDAVEAVSTKMTRVKKPSGRIFEKMKAGSAGLAKQRTIGYNKNAWNVCAKTLR